MREMPYNIARQIALTNLPYGARMAIMDAAAATLMQDVMRPEAHAFVMRPWLAAMAAHAVPTFHSRPAGDFHDWDETRPPFALPAQMRFLAGARRIQDEWRSRIFCLAQDQPRVIRNCCTRYF
jgi:hypothetical protein